MSRIHLKPLSAKLRQALAKTPEQNFSQAPVGSMRIKAAGTDTVDLLIYGMIGESFWGGETVTAKAVVEQLQGVSAKRINVRINSIGGSCHDGVAIHNELRRHAAQGAQIQITVDGLAASAASMIAMAGDEVVMPASALMMLHAPMGVLHVEGNAKEVEELSAEMIAVLHAWGAALATTYARKTGKTAEVFEELWATGEDYWFTAKEAKAFGLCDRIEDIEAADEPINDDETNALASHLLAAAPDRAMQIRAALRTAQASHHSAIQEIQMPNPTLPAPAGAEPTAAAMAALRDRNDEIRAMAAGSMSMPGVPDIVMDALADPSVTAKTVGQQLLALMARDRGPLNGGGSVVAYGGSSANGGSDLVAAASDLVALRAGIQIASPHAGVRDVSGMSIVDLMRACVARSGRNFGDSGSGGASLVRAAMSSSDFPAILENSLGKALRAGFAIEPATYNAWTRKTTVPDLKPQSRSILGSAPDLLPVAEGAEYQYGSLDEDKSLPFKVGKYGRIVALTWEALVNDDLGAFMRMTQALGQAAARAEGDIVYAQFAENAGAGPTMQDTNPLFHTSHNNIVAGPHATVDAASLGAARVLLRRQQAVGGGQLNLTPRYLLVAPELEQAAETLLAAAARSLTTGSDNALVPAWLARLELVVEARLPTDAFYVLTGPELVDTLERAWLAADNGPVIEEEGMFMRDVQQYKVKHVFGARWLDWRGAVKVPLTP